MSSLARRTWADILTEAIQAAGGINYTGYSTRMEYWINEAYQDLCLSVHQHELEVSTNGTLQVGSFTIALPPECFAVVGIGLLDDQNRVSTWLQPRRLQTLQSAVDRTAGPPSFYARNGFTILLERAPVVATPYLIWFYKLPMDPDFDGTKTVYPETGRVWDGHIVQGALAKAMGRSWRPDLAQIETQSLYEWLQIQTQSLLNTVIVDQPSVPKANQAVGGAQG